MSSSLQKEYLQSVMECQIPFGSSLLNDVMPFMSFTEIRLEIHAIDLRCRPENSTFVVIKLQVIFARPR